MKIGYACQCLNNEIPAQRTCIQKSLTHPLLMDIISHNLYVLDEILEYNHDHHITMFRLSSDLIPFGSSPANTMNWKRIFQPQFQSLGEKARGYKIRLSMHPGQYTLLNTPREDVLDRSIIDLRYHCDILNLLGMDTTNKLILHIGGIYKDKPSAIQRFINVFQTLDKDIQDRLVIENDDRYYTLEDVLYIAKHVHIPVIFDNLHHFLLPSLPNLTLKETLKLVQKTWKKQDGQMKIHYSQQDVTRRKGAHAIYLDGEAFMQFCEAIDFMNIDMMLEVKSKNLAVLQALDLLAFVPFDVESVWNHYRYSVLAHSLTLFNSIETTYTKLTAREFYTLLQEALSLHKEDDVTCYQLIYEEWYSLLDEKKQVKLKRALDRFQQHKLSQQALKNTFASIAYHVGQQDSYFFL